jgi:hypothetical protein
MRVKTRSTNNSRSLPKHLNHTGAITTFHSLRLTQIDYFSANPKITGDRSGASPVESCFSFSGVELIRRNVAVRNSQDFMAGIKK